MSFIFTPVLSDTFHRANSNNLGPNYSHDGFPDLNIVSNTARTDNSLVGLDRVVQALPHINQYVTVSVAAMNPDLVNNGTALDFYFRSQDNQLENSYVLSIFQSANSGRMQLQATSIVANSFNPPFIDVDNVVWSPTDKFTLLVVGDKFTLLQNSTVLATAADTLFISGAFSGLDIFNTVDPTDGEIGYFEVGTVALPITEAAPKLITALRLIGQSNKDFVHFLNSSNQVIGWVDFSGFHNRLGNPGPGAPLPAVSALLTIPGNASKDFVHFVDQKGNIVAWVDSDGIYRIPGSILPKRLTEKILIGNPSKDCFQMTDSLGNIIAWVDYTGTLNGTL